MHTWLGSLLVYGQSNSNNFYKIIFIFHVCEVVTQVTLAKALNEIINKKVN